MESEPVHGRELGQYWQLILDWISSSSSRTAHIKDDVDVSCKCLF